LWRRGTIFRLLFCAIFGSVLRFIVLAVFLNNLHERVAESDDLSALVTMDYERLCVVQFQVDTTAVLCPDTFADCFSWIVFAHPTLGVPPDSYISEPFALRTIAQCLTQQPASDDSRLKVFQPVQSRLTPPFRGVDSLPVCCPYGSFRKLVILAGKFYQVAIETEGAFFDGVFFVATIEAARDRLPLFVLLSLVRFPKSVTCI
jgi:hypothetical protein